MQDSPLGTNRRVNILHEMRDRLKARKRTRAEQKVYQHIKTPKKRKKKWPRRKRM